MSNASVRLKGLCQIRFALLDELLQFGNLPNFFECTDFILLVAVNGKACRVIASVFKSREACNPSVIIHILDCGSAGVGGDLWAEKEGGGEGVQPLSRVSRTNLRSLSTR